MTDGWLLAVLLVVIVGSFTFGEWRVRKLRRPSDNGEEG